MTASEVIETRNARVWLGDDGIVRNVQKPGTEETLDTAKENVAAVAKVSRGEKRPLLVDMVAAKSITYEAREFYSANETTSEVLAVALLIGGSPLSRVIGSFFMRVKVIKYPIKLFTSEVDAVEWLRGFLR